jgi:predicted O-linked N-acetylglucosamine transferase (SPINDLY family)
VPEPAGAESLAEGYALALQGRSADAWYAVQRVIGHQGASADAHALLAQIALDQGDWNAAAEQARRCLDLSRDNSSAWYALGRAHKQLGHLDTAIACYRRALLGAPANPELLTSLGTALVLAGRTGSARRIYHDILSRDPAHPGANASLAALTAPAASSASVSQLAHEAENLRRAGRLVDSLRAYIEALAMAPRSAALLLSTGMLLNQMGRQPESIGLFEDAVSADPSLVPAIEAARRMCVGAGLIDKARHYTGMLLERQPTDDLRLGLALCVGSIPLSVTDLHRSRAEYERALDAAIAGGLRGSDLQAAHVSSAFYLAYHGVSNARLQCKAATLMLQAFPDLRMVAPHCTASERPPGRIRVGFISAFLGSHSIGMTTRGLVAELNRDLFEVYSLHLPPLRRDAVSEVIRRSADRSVDIAPEISRAREQIAALELDVLFFQDIGMEPMSYRLALSRLAHVQCVSYGHPDTTGIPNMDYFVSNDLYEPPGAEAHYTERLFQLRDLPTLAYYYRPAAPESLPDRAEFGLHPNDHVYLCPQTLFKLHPEFDFILRNILRKDPRGIVVLISALYDDHTKQLHDRLARTIGDVVERILLLDRMPAARYMQLLAVSDVCLDTIYFNGMNTSLEALSVGVPIVTLPGPLQRSRHTQAMYRKLGVTDCIAESAEDYASIAVRLACDPQFAGSVRQRIRERSAVLYEDARVVREFERFFVTALREKRPDLSWPETRDAG